MEFPEIKIFGNDKKKRQFAPALEAWIVKELRGQSTYYASKGDNEDALDVQEIADAIQAGEELDKTELEMTLYVLWERKNI